MRGPGSTGRSVRGSAEPATDPGPSRVRECGGCEPTPNSLRGMERIAVLGGGRMGAALVAGLLDAGLDPESVAVAEADAQRRHELESLLPGVRIAPSAPWVVGDVDVVVVAVKPADVAAVLESALSALGPDTLVVSIAAGVSIAAIEAAAPGRPVVRAMPNTPALVREGVAAVAGGTNASDAHVETARRLLGAVGSVVVVAEPALDAVTGLSGSGPAYVFLLAEAMIEAGVLNGLPRDVAAALVHGTIRGAGVMLTDSGDTAEQLRAAVTSPGGTTAAGLRALEVGAMRAAVLEAVTAATRRSRELAGQ